MIKDYDLLYIYREDDEDAILAFNDWFAQYIESKGGQMYKADIWGKKRLAYEIDGIMEAVYVLISFNAPCKAEDEIEKELKAKQELLKIMIIRKGN